jgi:hypothetical protein
LPKPPEGGDLIGGEGHNHALWFLEPKSGGHDAMGTAVTERGSRAMEVLQLVRPCWQWMAGMKAIQRAEHAEAMVDANPRTL